MSRLITLSQAYQQFQEISQDIPQDDEIMLNEEWSNYTDSLCKDGELTDLQYHHCPAYDDMDDVASRLPDDWDGEFVWLLEQCGVEVGGLCAFLNDRATKLTVRFEGKTHLLWIPMGYDFDAESALSAILSVADDDSYHEDEDISHQRYGGNADTLSHLFTAQERESLEEVAANV